MALRGASLNSAWFPAVAKGLAARTLVREGLAQLYLRALAMTVRASPLACPLGGSG